MYRQKNTRSKDDAVSPVVGVMLMLVVTIIIAAVVSSFASGLGTTTTAAPVASYEFTISAGDTGKSTDGYPIELRVLAGDSIPSKDLQIITTYTIPEIWRGTPLANAGRVIKHTLDGSLSPYKEGTTTKDTAIELDTNIDGYPFTPQVNGYTDTLFPNTNDFQQTAHFGTCTFEPTTTYYFSQPIKFLGFDISDPKYGFGEGSIVSPHNRCSHTERTNHL
ncbi:MAG: type IV pilin N-terminal domain-containing protein [Methanocalculaceae archaeon]|jgi:FlaG/FlaF family flagellin (archaellin)|nr:type IV pilin N-terminal domain-containing protein [Methanocalculaceae archaeon]